MEIKYSKDKKVRFYSNTHKYLDYNDNVLTSVTQLLHKYDHIFDESGEIIANYAKKNNMTINEVEEMWKEINEESCIYGSKVHAEIEHFILTGEIRDTEHKIIVENFSKIKFEGKLHAEVLLHSLKYKVAGQADIIEELPNKFFNTWDIKSNKKLEKKSPWGNYMKKHLWFLESCNFNIYQLQLSMYAYLCELRGLTPNKLTILYVNPKTKDIELHECKYMKREVIKTLEKNIIL